MRTKMSLLAVVAALAVGLAATVGAADEVTLKGSVLCAKCTLKRADAKECQDVLVVQDQKVKKEYYLTKNDVLEKFGHTCTGEKKAEVTGQVSEKDGKTWMTATKIEAMK
jgi:hypothetical protein